MKATARIFLLTLFATSVAGAQSDTNWAKWEASVGAPAPVKSITDLKFKHSSFTFVRVRYSGPADGPSMWSTDFPDAHSNFSARIQKITGLKIDQEGLVLVLTNSSLSRYPFLYIAEGGRLHLSDEEVASLRRYLTGGGFLMVDDFWGEAEWKSLHAQMKRVFPEREPQDLAIDHPLFHCFYDLQQKPQVPNVALGMQSENTGITWEREDGKEPHYRGLFDDRGRLMAVFCHNTDLADGWEHANESHYYCREFSLKKAFPMGINIVVYALTQ